MSQVIIDDQDLSRVNYTGVWIEGGSPQEHDGTVASSTRVGDFFTVHFTGTAITVYGTIDSTSGGVLTNYSVDSAAPAQVTSQAGAGDTVKQQFWSSPPLELGNHNLVVTMAKVNPSTTPGEGTIWFDYFVATDPQIHDAQVKASRHKLIGGIIGGILGALLLLVIFAHLLFLRRRKQRQKPVHVQPIFWPGNDSAPNLREGSVIPFGVTETRQIHPTIDPWIMSQDGESHRLSGSSSSSTRPSNSSSRKAELLLHRSTGTPRSVPSRKVITRHSLASFNSETSDRPSNSEGTRHRTHGSQDLEAIPEHRPSTGQTIDSATTETVQHVDSGVRNVETSVIPNPDGRVELPPVYSPL